MKGHGSKFGRKKEAAIAALMTQRTHEEAARATGIDLKTLKRWMRVPEFIEAYRRARWEAVEQAQARAQQNSGAATSVLLKLMADPATPPASRIRAALGIATLAGLARTDSYGACGAHLDEHGRPTRPGITIIGRWRTKHAVAACAAGGRALAWQW